MILKHDKTEVFETMPVRRAVLHQLVPAVFSQLVALMYSLGDTFFVGRLNSPAQSAAVTVSGAIFLVLTAISNLFGIGGASLISRKLGVKKDGEVSDISSFSFWFGIISAAVFGVAALTFNKLLLPLVGANEASLPYAEQYLFYAVTLGAIPTVATTLLANLVRAEGAAFEASFGVMLGCFVNLLLDPVFVLPFGLNMGAAGAGAATAVSNAAGLVYFLFYLKKRKTLLSIDPRFLRRSLVHSREIMRIGLPSALQYLLTVVAVCAQFHFVSKYGERAVAAVGIAKKLDQLPLFFSIGVATALLPLIGYNYARGDIDRMKKASRFGISLSLGFAVLCVIVYEAFSAQLTGLFIDDAKTVSYAASFLRRMVTAMPFMSVCYPLITKFQAMGKARQSLIVSLLRKGVLDIPLYLIYDMLLPLYGCMWVQPSVDTISLIAALILNKRLERTLHTEKTL